MNDIKMVVFDCDGVLVDSEIISSRILISRLAAVGVHVDLAHVHKHFLGRSWSKVAAEVRTSHGLSLKSDFEELYRQDLLTAFETELQAMVGVEDVLRRIDVPFCVATSSSPKRVRRSLAITRLAPFFGDRIYTASQVKNGKPAPDIFQFVARSMDFDPGNCLVIEDSLPGVQAGIAAGMQVWRFTGGSHLNIPGLDSPAVDENVSSFDNWQQFFEMAPELEQQPGGKLDKYG